MSQFVQQLRQEGVFAKEVRTGGLAFHSYFMEAIAPSLLQALKKVGWPPRGCWRGLRKAAVGLGPGADPAGLTHR